MTKNKDNWSGKDYHKNSSTQHQGGLAALADYPFKGDVSGYLMLGVELGEQPLQLRRKFHEEKLLVSMHRQA